MSDFQISNSFEKLSFDLYIFQINTKSLQNVIRTNALSSHHSDKLLLVGRNTKITAFLKKYMYMFKKVAKEDSKKLIGLGMVKIH